MRAEGVDLLTQEEVDKLKDGTRITVIWSGGNVPHDYIVDSPRFGVRFALADVDGQWVRSAVLRYVGSYPLTQVWLTPS
jgi:ornithine carbamoyltransferase